MSEDEIRLGPGTPDFCICPGAPQRCIECTVCAEWRRRIKNAPDKQPCAFLNFFPPTDPRTVDIAERGMALFYALYYSGVEFLKIAPDSVVTAYAVMHDVVDPKGRGRHGH